MNVLSCGVGDFKSMNCKKKKKTTDIFLLGGIKTCSVANCFADFVFLSLPWNQMELKFRVDLFRKIQDLIFKSKKWLLLFFT